MLPGSKQLVSGLSFCGEGLASVTNLITIRRCSSTSKHLAYVHDPQSMGIWKTLIASNDSRSFRGILKVYRFQNCDIAVWGRRFIHSIAKPRKYDFFGWWLSRLSTTNHRISIRGQLDWSGGIIHLHPSVPRAGISNSTGLEGRQDAA